MQNKEVLPKVKVESKPPKKNKILKLRISENDLYQIEMNMLSQGYSNRSKYILNCALNGIYGKPVKTGTEPLARQFDRYLSVFINIGSNWNMYVQSYKEACKKKRADGSPVVNTGFTETTMNKMSETLDKIIGLQRQIKKLFENQKNK